MLTKICPQCRKVFTNSRRGNPLRFIGPKQFSKQVSCSLACGFRMKFIPNEVRFDGGECCISLGNTKFEARVDSADYERIKDLHWYQDSLGYVCNGVTKKRLHQHIVGTVNGLVIDHINGDRLDNRRSNLRFVSTQENIRNNCSKGYHYDNARKKWVVSIKVMYRIIHVGRFKTEAEAVIARRAAEVKYWGYSRWRT